MSKALEFKGRMLSVSRLRVLAPDPLAVEAQIREFAAQMPAAMQGMPVVIEAEQALELGGILAALKAAGLQPLGVSEGPLAASAQAWGLPILPAEGKGTRAPPARSDAAPAAAPAPVRKSTRIVAEPVRSGQQIYAADADLVVLNLVGQGAEVIADGCLHVYGAARGRLVAGARGDGQARIFCRRFEAELVSIAGTYAVAEQIEPGLRGKPVQAFLVDGKLKIEKLEG